MLDGKQRQVARALARRRFEAAAELDEAAELQIARHPNERFEPEPELAPGCGLEWPAWLMIALVLIVMAGTGYVLVHG
jgi:hypothetical protein